MGYRHTQGHMLTRISSLITLGSQEHLGVGHH